MQTHGFHFNCFNNMCLIILSHILPCIFFGSSYCILDQIFESMLSGICDQIKPSINYLSIKSLSIFSCVFNVLHKTTSVSQIYHQLPINQNSSPVRHIFHQLAGRTLIKRPDHTGLKSLADVTRDSRLILLLYTESFSQRSIGQIITHNPL